MEIMLLPVNTIPKGCSAVVLMGQTGAGKSTFGNWLLGKKVEKNTVEAANESDDDHVSVQCTDPSLEMGSGRSSMTFAPNVRQLSNDTYLIDYPGFDDSGGFEVRIGMDLAFRSMVEYLKPAHVIALIPIGSNESGRGKAVKEQISKITRLLPTENAALSSIHRASELEACRWKVGVTMCSKGFVCEPKEKLEVMTSFLEELEPSLKGQIINVNKYMFGQAGRPQDLIDTIKVGTRTPLIPNDELRKAVEECFPSDNGLQAYWESIKAWKNDRFGSKKKNAEAIGSACLTPSNLLTDCLNPNDTANLQTSLSTYEFLNIFCLCTLDESQPAKDFSGGVNDFATALENIRASVTALCDHRSSIKRDSDNLVLHSVLSVESRFPQIHKLLSQRQCRLKQSFVEVEKRLMNAEMAFLQENYKSYVATIKILCENNLLRLEDREGLNGKIKEVEQSFDKDVQRLGYVNVGRFLKNTSAVLGVSGGVAGVGMLCHVGYTSTSLVAWLSGTGSYAALSAGATAGLATGGILLAVGALTFLVWRASDNKIASGDKYSKQLAAELNAGMQEAMEAHTACAEHQTKLTSIGVALKKLEVTPKD